MIFESHAHYEDKRFDEDREALLASFPENGIEYVINVGSSIKTTKATLELIKKYDFMFGAVGVHPEESAELNEENFAWLKSIRPEDISSAKTKSGVSYSLNHEKALCIFLEDGEVPLDNNATEGALRSFCLHKHTWKLIDTVNAMVLLNGEAKFASFIDQMNILIDRQKTVLKARATNSAKKNGEEA